MDEIQLTSGIYFHSRSHEVTGFATDGDGIKINNEISNLLSESKKSNDGSLVKEIIGVEEKGVSTYVNQWRFRSSYNDTRNLEFFFNEGNTKSSEIIRQFLHVVMCLYNCVWYNYGCIRK